MKVLLINNRHYHGGGADVVYFTTAKLLEESGHEVVFFSKVTKNQEPYELENYFAPNKDNYGSLKRMVSYCNNQDAASALERLLSIKHFDIAHAHLIWGGVTPAIIPVLHKHGIPLVHTAHDYRMICPAYLLKDGHGQECDRCKGGKFYQCLLHKCAGGNIVKSLLMTAEMYYRNIKWPPAKTLDGCIFVSNFSRNKHIEFDNRFADAKTMVLYNCPSEHVSESLLLSNDTYESYFLFYGRLSVEKGIFTLLQAFKQYPSLHLKVVGTGPLEKKIINYCEEHGLKNINLLGYKSGKQLFDLVAKAKYVCVPSECYENNPMTIVEAYSLRTPVIGADIGGISEIVQDGKTGYTFKSGNVESLCSVIEKAVSEDRFTYEMKKNEAFKFSESNFSRVKYLEKLLHFYEVVISTRAKI